MDIVTNSTALISANALNLSNSLAAQASQRISTTLRINNAGDDPVGLRLANKLKTQISSNSKVVDNINSGIGMLQTMDSSLSQISTLLSSMKALAVSSASSTTSPSDKTNNQTLFSNYMSQIDSISKSATWNNYSLLNNNSIATISNINFGNSGSNPFTSFSAVVNGNTLNVNTLNSNDTTLTNLATDLNNQLKNQDSTLSVTSDTNSNSLIIKSSGSESISNAQLTLALNNTSGASAGTLALSTPATMTLQTGANVGDTTQVSLYSTLSTSLASGATTLSSLNISTADGATTAMSAIDQIASTVSQYQSAVGASENIMNSRLTLTNAINTVQSTQYGNIMDANLAQETANLASAQIQQSSASAMLAQANSMNKEVVSYLLKGLITQS